MGTSTALDTSFYPSQIDGKSCSSRRWCSDCCYCRGGKFSSAEDEVRGRDVTTSTSHTTFHSLHFINRIKLLLILANNYSNNIPLSHSHPHTPSQLHDQRKWWETNFSSLLRSGELHLVLLQAVLHSNLKFN